MPYCQNCGAELGTEGNFCARCGQKINADKLSETTSTGPGDMSSPPASSGPAVSPAPVGPALQYIRSAYKHRNVWRIAFIISLVIFIPLCIFLLVLYSNTSNKLDETSLALDKSQQQVASLQVDLSATRQTLAEKQLNLAETQQNLASTITDRDSYKLQLSDTRATLLKTQTDLSDTQQDLNTMTGDRDSYKAQLAASQTNVASLQKQVDTVNGLLSTAQAELSNATSTLSGLGITLYSSKNCIDVKLEDNASAKNPAWKELTAFLAQDKTEDHTYIKGEYDCSQFSRDLHNNAEAAGIRAAEVQVRFEGELTGHALNAFLTSDYGLVYIDCTNSPDTIAHVKKGKEYRAVDITGYNITFSNITNDTWWENLLSYGIAYYYLPQTLSLWGDEELVTSAIRIYW